MPLFRPWSRFPLAALACSLLFLSIAAPSTADVCQPSIQPAATLLFPYFEVDLSDPAGRTTLISIHNAGDEPTVARVTLWTNVALPTLGFDLVLDPRQVQSISLRDLLAGSIPLTDVDAQLPNCSDPLVLPELDANDVADLVAWHTGAPDLGGVCRGVADDDEPSLATGYVTVDAMNQCITFYTYPGDTTVFPGDIRYFEDGGVGLASNANVLWGDMILLDPSGDSAQSVAAAHARADADRFQGFSRTFYGLGADDRAPLPATYRGQFLAGQPADTETSFQLWLDPVGAAFFPPAGFTCGEASDYTNSCRFIEAQAYGAAGQEIDETFFEGSDTVLRRLKIAPTAGVGTIELRHRELVACQLLPGPIEPRPAVMIPLLKSEGRFSVAGAAVALDSTCWPEP